MHAMTSDHHIRSDSVATAVRPFPPVRPFAPSPPASSTAPTTRMVGSLDGGCPFYAVYTCADGRWMSVGCLEPQFYAAFLERFVHSLPDGFVVRLFPDDGEWKPTVEKQYDMREWPRLKQLFEEGFRLFGRDHWETIFHGEFSPTDPKSIIFTRMSCIGSDACTVPVLSPAEAALLAISEPSTASVSDAGAEFASTPAPHPQLSRTPALPLDGTGHIQEDRPYLVPGTHTEEVLHEVLGLGSEEIARLRVGGALGLVSSRAKL
jgi:alpha-methylacyl-CoA racemase